MCKITDYLLLTAVAPCFGCIGRNDLFMENNQNQSHLLGQFVAMVQAVEENHQEGTPKGAGWGTQIFQLLQANLPCTMELLGRILATLPDTTQLNNGKMINLAEIYEIISKLDVPHLTLGGLNAQEFQQGYFHYSNETMDLSSDHSYNMGIFMAKVTCMEMCANDMSRLGIVEKAEDIITFLEVNFQTTLDLVIKIITSLPDQAVYNGKELTKHQLIQAYSLLDLDYLRVNGLVNQRFTQGYEGQMDFYQS